MTQFIGHGKLPNCEVFDFEDAELCSACRKLDAISRDCRWVWVERIKGRIIVYLCASVRELAAAQAVKADGGTEARAIDERLEVLETEVALLKRDVGNLDARTKGLIGFGGSQ